MGTTSICIAALVFIFVARLRFTSGLSIVETLRNRYGTDLVKNIRKMEKTDYKYRKLQLDLNFLQNCQHSNFISKFCNLSWQIEIYYRFWLTIPNRKDY